MHKILMEVENLSKYLPINLEEMFLSGIIEVRKDIKLQLIEKVHVKIVEVQAIPKNNALKDQEK